MKALSELRAGIIRFYNSKDMYILPVLKFVIAFVLFLLINKNYGFMENLNNIFIVLILSLICALLPFGGTAAIGIILIVIHCFGISMEVGVFAAGLYLLLFILFMRFVPGESIAVLISPFAFNFYIPSVVPVTLGMLGKAASALAAVCSVISVFFLRSLPDISLLIKTGKPGSLEILKLLIGSLINNTEMYMMIIVFAATTLIVYLVRKICSTYGWLVSILAGTGVYLAVFIGGSVFLEVKVDLVPVILGSLVSAGIALVIAFFRFNVNYRGSRYLQFEDDDYYYYVKAIPKVKTVYDEEDDDEDYFRSEDEREEGEKARKDNHYGKNVSGNADGATKVLPRINHSHFEDPQDKENRRN